ncbi:MAG TPA: thioesterase family protein [Candidatus Tumulicola sp.]
MTVRYKESVPAGARIFETRVRTQWCDVDVAGIVYFGAYWRFVERAEMEFFAELGFPYDRVFGDYSFWLPRVHCEAQYHAPALMDDWLRLRTHLEKVGASSVRWRTVVFNERTGEPGAQFAITVACISAEHKTSRPLPPVIRSALLACLGPQ